MAQDKVNPIANTSYVNKDFQSIYPELLDLVKQLTYKWDPSISNESDPGVVLLKLNALIADKCNYNIDKNVLECFPLSVTQESNARQLYEQLGYYMHWYKSATTKVSMKWIGDTSSSSYTIPAFTMVSDYSSSKIYTLLGPSSDTETIIQSQSLSCDNSVLSFNAIQGVAVKYSINGEELIQYSHLDSNKRLYFDTIDIAENGIFITNTTPNYSSWIKKDNLLVESTGNTFYSFGVSKEGDKCYIEFPEDAESLIKDGIYITYVKTLGEDGNVQATEIEKFYNNLVPTEDSSIVLSEENVKIQNIDAAVNGYNPEDIDEAYKNYRRTIGTFNTLVTLRDYINYIMNSGLVSTCFVTDRTNDPQCSYKILTDTNGIAQDTTIIETSGATPSLTAFDLKLYLTHYVEAVTNEDLYDKTFELQTKAQSELVKTYIENSKSIQHNYVDLLGPSDTPGKSHICYFKNKYPLNITITTQYSLTEAEAEDVVNNIKLALFKELNAKEIEFGEEISMDLIYNAIEECDSRIRKISLDALDYTTYAVFYDPENDVPYTDVQISGREDDATAAHFDLVPTYSPDAAHTTRGLTATVTAPVTFVSKVLEKAGLSLSEVTFKIVDVATTPIWKWVKNETESETVTLADWGLTATFTGTAAENDSFIVHTNELISQALEEIYTKSVLAGVTQFYVHDEPFDFRWNQSKTNVIDDIIKLGGNCTISFDQDHTEKQMRLNETLQFYAPNVIDETTYSSGVKFEYYIANPISKNSCYQLGSNEYVILYWKEEEDSTAIYKYYSYGEGNVISPSFDMAARTTAAVGQSLAQKGTTLRNVGTTTYPKWIGDSKYNGDMSAVLSEAISELTESTYILSGTKSIKTKVVNTITLDATNNYCYWVLNDKDENGQYVLFKADTSVSPVESSWKRVLNAGEYFIYTNSALTDLAILGSGTEIVRKTPSGTPITNVDWAVDAIDSSDIVTEGATALANVWFTIPSSTQIIITENQYVDISPGGYVRITKPAGGSWSLSFTSQPSSSLDGYKIEYRGATSETYTELSSLSLADYGSWRGRTKFSVTLSDTEELKLLSGQKLIYRLESDTPQTQDHEISGGDLDETGTRAFYPVVFLSSVAIDNPSGELVNVQYTENKVTKNVSLYQFKEYQDTTDIYYSSTGSLSVKLTPSSPDAYIPHCFINHVAMFKMTHVQKSLSSLTLSVGSGSSYTNLHAMPKDNTTATSFKDPGTYFVYLPESNTEQYLKISATGLSAAMIVTLYNPYMYSYPDTMPRAFISDSVSDKESSAEIIEKLLRILDPTNLFNYTHEISSDDEISNPLSGKSFNKTNHIFNSRTICQMDTTANSTIQVLGKR